MDIQSGNKLDMDMGFWIKGLHYVWLPDEELDYTLSQRIYILPDNCIVASEGEIYEYQEEVNLCDSDSPQVQIAKNLLQFISIQNAVKKYKGQLVKVDGKVVGRVDELLSLWLLEQRSFGRIFESLYPKKQKSGKYEEDGIYLDVGEGPENFIYLDLQLPKRKRQNCIPFNLILQPQGKYLANYNENHKYCKLTKFGKITSIINQLKLQNKGFKVNRQFLPFVINMIPNFPLLKYKSFEKNIKFNNHHGQRKLLNSEIEFLSRFTIPTRDYIIVYAGAADGRHIPLLAELFPNCVFILYDPAPFAINPSERIMIRNKLFLDEDVEEIMQTVDTKNLLFISDIRSVPPKDTPKEFYNAEFEKHVHFDLGLQKGWVQRLRVPSMLKFRLPYTEGSLMYFSGDIMIQNWAPPDSTESRLIVTDFDTMVEYDQKTYEEQFYYFNAVYRPSQFYDKDLVFGQSYDVYREAYAWRMYLDKYLNVKGGHPYENIFRMMEISDYFLDRKGQYVTRNLK